MDDQTSQYFPPDTTFDVNGAHYTIVRVETIHDVDSVVCRHENLSEPLVYLPPAIVAAALAAATAHDAILQHKTATKATKQQADCTCTFVWGMQISDSCLIHGPSSSIPNTAQGAAALSPFERAYNQLRNTKFLRVGPF